MPSICTYLMYYIQACHITTTLCSVDVMTFIKNIVNHCFSVIGQHLCLLTPAKVNKINMKVFFFWLAKGHPMASCDRSNIHRLFVSTCRRTAALWHTSVLNNWNNILQCCEFHFQIWSCCRNWLCFYAIPLSKVLFQCGRAHKFFLWK